MSKCAPHFKATIHSGKHWDDRTPIAPNIIVLHSTESPPMSGRAVSDYLARFNVEADVQVVADTDGDLYELVPVNRKAWHVANHNNHALGIEQVGRAAQTHWPAAQLDAVARLLAFWSYHHRIPLRDARGVSRFLFGSYRGGAGIVEHGSLGVSGGGHVDPGKHYPFRKVLKMARRHKRICYGSVRAYAKG